MDIGLFNRWAGADFRLGDYTTIGRAWPESPTGPIEGIKKRIANTAVGPTLFSDVAPKVFISHRRNL